MAVACALAVGVAATAVAACKRDGNRERAVDDTGDGDEPHTRRDASDGADVRPYRIVLTHATINTVDPEKPRQIPVPELTKALASMLTKAEHYAHAAHAVPAHMRPRAASLEVVISYDVVEGDISVTVDSVLSWDESSDDLIPSQKIIAARPVSAADRSRLDEVVAGFVAQTVQRSAEALIAKEAIRTGVLAGVIEGVRASDTEIATWALAVAGDRKLIGAFDVVVAALSSKNRDMRMHAVAALVEIADPRAVDFMAKSVEFTDHEMLESVIEAVAALGGEDARMYLDFVATGHPDMGIRAKAATALARLD